MSQTPVVPTNIYTSEEALILSHSDFDLNNSQKKVNEKNQYLSSGYGILKLHKNLNKLKFSGYRVFFETTVKIYHIHFQINL